jgi:hypothetical protein
MEHEDRPTEPSFFTGEDVITPKGVDSESANIFNGQGVSETLSGKPRTKRRLTMSVLAVVVVLVISFVVIGGSGPGSNDAAAQVAIGARATLAENSVTLNLSGSFSVNGQTIPVSGSGFADLSSKVETMSASFSADGTSVQEIVISNGPSAYMQMLENSQNVISELLPGKQWVQMPVGAATSAGLGIGSPNILGQLQVLSEHGNAVTSLGSSTINGEPVTGYQVTLTQAAMLAAIKRQESHGGAEAQAVKSFLKTSSFGGTVFKLWLGSDHLLAREEVTLSLTADGTTGTGDMTMDFSRYGSPVSVSIPAAGSVASLSVFEAAAKAAG